MDLLVAVAGSHEQKESAEEAVEPRIYPKLVPIGVTRAPRRPSGTCVIVRGAHAGLDLSWNVFRMATIA